MTTDPGAGWTSWSPAPAPADARTTDPGPSAPDVAPLTPPAGPSARRARRSRVVTTVLLTVTTLVGAGAATYLWRTSDAWQERAEDYERVNTDLGADLAGTRDDLAATTAELESVRTQLATAQDRIIELADEKAQLGDDREAQRQLADYQERVSEAAGRVALALDQCVQGQNQLIGYLENAELYDPAELDAYGVQVAALCQDATDANAALQAELSG